jgi:hypothetical protein
VPLPRLPRLVEPADEELPDVVDGARRDLPVLRLEELLDVARPDVLEELPGDGRAQDVALIVPSLLTCAACWRLYVSSHSASGRRPSSAPG